MKYDKYYYEYCNKLILINNRKIVYNIFLNFSDYRELTEYSVTSVRLISSGFFDNFVTVQIQPLKNELFNANIGI